jgi:predicted nucleic acid-binding protein
LARVKSVLLDTGPIVASLDADDPHHGAVYDSFSSLTGLVITTGAVVTEAMFFLQNLTNGPTRLTEWLRGIHAEIVNCFDPESLQSAALLMERYADAPMDYADATLVACADELNCGDILTLDIRGFRTYRYQRNKRFKLLLQDG